MLGSGLLEPYPRSHIPLFNEVVSGGGTVLSCFPLLTAAKPGNFPARNRIIAGLSTGCIVIQAAAQSGTRITAQYALEYGRDVFAVPGSIDDPLSAGCHDLLQEGAMVASNADVIMQTLGITKVQHVPDQKRIPTKHKKRTTQISLIILIHKYLLYACTLYH